MVADPRSQGVDRHDPAGHRLPAGPLKDGVGHGAAAPLLLHRAEEDILLPGPDRPLHIALIEKREIEGPGVVHHLDLDQLQALPDTGPSGVLRGHGRDAHPGPQRGLTDGADLSAVLIVPGIVGQQVTCGLDPQLGQLLGPLLSHPRQLRHGGIQR